MQISSCLFQGLDYDKTRFFIDTVQPLKKELENEHVEGVDQENGSNTFRRNQKGEI